jgi:hypothetical protein
MGWLPLGYLNQSREMMHVWLSIHYPCEIGRSNKKKKQKKDKGKGKAKNKSASCFAVAILHHLFQIVDHFDILRFIFCTIYLSYCRCGW